MMDVIGGVLVIGLIGYLFVSVLKPEWF
ncbi:MAG: K(+)-transporting ATPase subunit F [Candidatus Hydrogenedentes bacterium]|nr:K(+)-transporting ATPase subunit F [Candidatus Hydrogenedentota bacterium]